MEPDKKNEIKPGEGEQGDRLSELEQAVEEGGKKKRKKSFWREVGEWAASLLAAVVVVAPKVGASDETANFAITAKASPFGRGGIAKQ